MKYQSIALFAGIILILGIEGCSGKTAEAPFSSDLVKIWGTVTSVDDSGITVDNQSGNSSSGEILLTVDPEQNTVIDAVTGFPVALDEIETGSFEAYLGPVMTMSLPPQTSPYMVIVNIPADGQAPQYFVAAGEPVMENGTATIKASDGSSYQIPEDAQVLPFLTKNIVRLDEIAEGSRCLIWLDENEIGEKIVLFR